MQGAQRAERVQEGRSKWVQTDWVRVTGAQRTQQQRKEQRFQFQLWDLTWATNHQWIGWKRKKNVGPKSKIRTVLKCSDSTSSLQRNKGRESSQDKSGKGNGHCRWESARLLGLDSVMLSQPLKLQKESMSCVCWRKVSLVGVWA